jgi:hypothetical protein
MHFRTLPYPESEHFHIPQNTFTSLRTLPCTSERVRIPQNTFTSLRTLPCTSERVRTLNQNTFTSLGTFPCTSEHIRTLNQNIFTSVHCPIFIKLWVLITLFFFKLHFSLSFSSSFATQVIILFSSSSHSNHQKHFCSCEHSVSFHLTDGLSLKQLLTPVFRISENINNVFCHGSVSCWTLIHSRHSHSPAP